MSTNNFIAQLLMIVGAVCVLFGAIDSLQIIWNAGGASLTTVIRLTPLFIGVVAVAIECYKIIPKKPNK